MRLLHTDKRGQGMVEYILLVALIAIALIAAWGAFKSKINTKIDNAGTAIEKAGN